jgi:hypothetical protein
LWKEKERKKGQGEDEKLGGQEKEEIRRTTIQRHGRNRR